jgi:serine/threonine-protein kinase
MLSGARAYTGEMLTDVVAAVITKEPDWSRLPTSVPRRVRDLLELCLQRDPASAFRPSATLEFLSNDFLSRSGDANDQERAQHSFAVSRMVPWVIAHRAGDHSSGTECSLAPRPSGEERLTMLSATSAGRRSVHFPVMAAGRFGQTDVRSHLWPTVGGRSGSVELDSPTARELPGSEVASVSRFWKPDGQFLAFIAGGDEADSTDREARPP